MVNYVTGHWIKPLYFLCKYLNASVVPMCVLCSDSLMKVTNEWQLKVCNPGCSAKLATM